MKKSDVPSIISSEVAIKGGIISEGEIRIDGRIDGDIECKIVIVGVNGIINGNINAQTAKIHGVLNGNLVAKSVVFGGTAKIKGDVRHQMLAIEPGAFIEGHCRRDDETAEKKT
ncbi:MAG: polymer-forming cytoskeletal protein [Alphaproteobacteria bacterium]|nr:polymer-forming cytoskeletal protein [Alphaproteobacteria bacterium]